MLHFDGEKKETKEFELIEKGEYEVVLNAEWDERNGAKYINCVFKVRDDVDQKFGRRRVFYPIRKYKDSEEYNENQINNILSAIPNAQKDFETYDELIQYINDKHMIAVIDIQPATEQWKAKNFIKALKPTLNQKIGTLEPANDISDDDIPF